MRTDKEKGKKESRDRLVVSVMALALASGAVLAMGSAPAKQATSPIEATKPASAVFASTMPDSISPLPAIADREVLDLQLD